MLKLTVYNYWRDASNYQQEKTHLFYKIIHFSVQLSAIVNRFIVKTELNSTFINDLKSVGNLVLRRRVSGTVKRDFRTYIRRYTSPNEKFEYGYPHSNALFTFSLQRDSEKCTSLRLYVQRQPAA